MSRDLGAFVGGPRLVVGGADRGPLAGTSFACKDLFDVRGSITGAGNPDWQRTHAPAVRSASAVDLLLNAGASLIGKTVTDEISLGLLGINRFDGTPVNPRACDRVPGGSSSGSAVAVAGGLAQTALGTDSGGSVRTPASFTGIYGLRPTHGGIPVEGMAVQSPSFDTAGYFARDAETFCKVGEVLLGRRGVTALPDELLIARDCHAICDDVVQDAVTDALPSLLRLLPSSREIVLAQEGIDHWAGQQQLLQSFEFGRTFRDWIQRTNPRFSFEVANALVTAMRLEEADVLAARRFRQDARSRMENLLEGRRVLCLPTVPILPIVRDASLTEMQAAVTRIIQLTCIAGLTGLPQVNLPMAGHQGIPVGVSLIGWPGADTVLLNLARIWEQSRPIAPERPGTLPPASAATASS